MSLLIKALNKAEEEAQAQSAKNALAQSEKLKPEQVKAAQLQTAQIGAAEDAPKPAKGQAVANNKLQTKAPANVLSPSNADVELSLSPSGSSFSDVAKPASTDIKVSNLPSSAPSSQQSNSQQLAAKSAANVFSAKGVEAKTDSKRIALIAGASLIALLGMGLYFYQFIDNTPDVVIPPRPLEQQASALAPERLPEQRQEMPATETQTVEREIAALPEQQAVPIKRAKQQTTNDDAALTDNETALDVLADDAVVVTKANKKANQPKSIPLGESIASPSASISVTKTKPEAGISPTLMSAYEAYNAGNNVDAQKLYKQVLQRDIRNIDALLGLGAIAARQGRSADAVGWYDKVLALDPRNNIAKAAMLDSSLQLQAQGNELANETSLKNMLAKQPDDANLHVALGNLYAEQNLWPAAQQAYFEAYSLNKSADNAYNLAVSLDQMGKPKLALPYYQLALEQASNASNIDKAALQARIAAIQ